jgi:addiction module RelB/DinJ family antitoxin
MKTTTSIKLDKDIKDKATILANELGLSLSSVINATLKKFVDERRVVLSVSPEFNKKTEEKFMQLREDVKNKKNLSGTYTNAEDLFKALGV